MDLGLEIGIWASRLEFRPRDFRGDTKKEKKNKENEEIIPRMCESIGH